MIQVEGYKAVKEAVATLVVHSGQTTGTRKDLLMISGIKGMD